MEATNIEPVKNVISLSFDVEKTKNGGEDAPPVFIHSGSYYFISVCDGMGGAGGTTYSVGSTQRSGAYISSRIINKEAELFFSDFTGRRDDFNEHTLTTLKTTFLTALQDELVKIKGENGSKLKSKLLKDLPTTFSGLLIQEKEQIIVDSIWAGDSRNYLLNATDGLQQLSSDDLKQKFDPFENLTKDSPLDNVVSADDDFLLHRIRIETSSPCILFSVTDGCYGYFGTPMQFENAMVQTMLSADSIDEWREKLIKEIGLVAGDDYSISLVALGFQSYAYLKESFQARSKKLYDAYISEIITQDELLNEYLKDKKGIEDKIAKAETDRAMLQKNTWASYKDIYLKHIPH